MTMLCTWRLMSRSSFPVRAATILSSPKRPYGSTQSSVKWILGTHSLGVKQPAREHEKSIHLMSRLKMSVILSPLFLNAFMACT